MPAAGAKVTITGLEAVKAAFKKIPDKARKIISTAERRALGIPKTAASARWPIRSGKSKRSIRLRVSKGPRGANRKYVISLALLVGGSGADKKGKARPWWSFLVEFGWQIGKRIRSAGKVVGRHKLAGGNRRVPGKHIMRIALRSTEERVKQVMEQEIIAGIEREISK